MQAKLKHIILACSNAGELALQQDFLGNAQPSIDITVAGTPKQLEGMLARQTPDLVIVLRMAGEEGDDNNFLRVIRRNEHHDEIPVFVYTIKAGKKDLVDLLKQWRKTFSYLPL